MSEMFPQMIIYLLSIVLYQHPHFEVGYWKYVLSGIRFFDYVVLSIGMTTEKALCGF